MRHRPDQNPRRHPDAAERLAHDPGAPRGNQLQRLGFGVDGGEDGQHLAAAQVAENGACRDEARRDRRVDAESGDQRHEVRPLDQGDDTPRAAGFRQQRGDEIGALVVRHGDHRVHVRDALFAQQPEVRGVAVQDQGAGQAVGEKPAARRVLLQQPHVIVRVVLLQDVRDVVAHPAAADDEHPPRRVGDDAQYVQVVADVVALADHQQVVIGLDDGVAGRDDGFLAPLDGGDEEGRRSVPHAGDVPQAMAHDGRHFLHPEHQELHATLEEVGRFFGARRADQATDLLGNRLARVDEQVDADVLAGLNERGLAKIRFVDPRDAAGHARLAGQQAPHQVDLVRAGNGDQHVRAVDLGVLQDLRTGGVAANGQHVQLLLDPVDELRGTVDNHHVVLLANQAPRHVVPDLSRSQNDDTQDTTSLLASPARRRPSVETTSAAGTVTIALSIGSFAAGLPGVVAAPPTGCQERCGGPVFRG